MSEQVNRSWDRIEAWLAANAPETFASLRPAAEPAAISGAADRLGVVLPDDVRASLLRHDGVADVEGDFTLAENRLMPVDRMIERSLGMVRSMQDLIESESESEDGGGEHYLLSGEYWHRQYVRLTDSESPDGLVIDCRQGDTHGAIGEFFNGEGTSFGEWASLGDLLEQLADALEGGRAFDGEVPVAFGGRLAWEPEPEPEPEPMPGP
jgi:cell wall assembly regulator SMI1